MTKTEVTLNEIMMAVRELTFDRFIIPAFALKQRAGFSVSIYPEDNGDKKAGMYLVNEEHKEQNKEYLFSVVTTMDELMKALIKDGIIVAYTPYYRGTESTSTLIRMDDRSLETPFTAFRTNFFSDAEIIETIRWYYSAVLDIRGEEITDDLVKQLIRPSEKHLTIWTSYQLVDKRRLYENAANAIGQTYTDGSDYMGSVDSSSGVGGSISTQIGSVFSITEDPSNGFFAEDFNRVGSDNVWGDRYSFWYKLMVYLRDLLETNFGDYSLRKNNVIPGNIELVRELDFRSYYDSYPFTLSPLSRGILSKTP